MLVATHNLRFVNEFCDRTLWLEKGKQIAFGPTRAVLTEYLERVSGQGARSLPDA
jgi:ABC-type polysaccharide/polyol phosphate transport system ATPase subunit